MGRQVTKAELAEIIGCDERTLSRWQQDGLPVQEFGLGRGNENLYDSAVVVAWLLKRATLNGQKETVRDRLDRVRAQREELAYAKDIGQVVLAADLQSRFEAMIVSAKLELLNTLPELLASQLSARYGVEVDDQLIRDPVELILKALSNYDPVDDDSPDGPDVAAEAEEDWD